MLFQKTVATAFLGCMLAFSAPSIAMGDAPLYHQFDGPKIKELDTIDILKDLQEQGIIKRLWDASCKRSADVQFIQNKVVQPTERNRLDLWIDQIGRSPYGDYPSLETLELANKTAFNPADKNAKKTVLNQSERLALFNCILELRKSLDNALLKVLSKNPITAKAGRMRLEQLAGAAEGERFEAEVLAIKSGKPADPTEGGR